MRLKPGDHICAIDRDDGELAGTVAEFLAEDLRRRERCWYLPAGDRTAPVRERLETRHVNVEEAIDRGAARIDLAGLDSNTGANSQRR